MQNPIGWCCDWLKIPELARGILSQSQYQWLVRAILHQAQGVFPVFVFLAKTRVSWCPIIYKVFSFRWVTRPRATCGTLPSRWVSMRTNSVLTPCKARCGTFTLPRNVKTKLFRAKTFNIFYIFGREKISTSSIRAPIKPRKFPQKHLENPQKHIEFSTSDVFLPLYWAKKRGESPVFRALSSSLVQRYNIFARNANRFNISQQPAKC